MRKLKPNSLTTALCASAVIIFGLVTGQLGLVTIGASAVIENAASAQVEE